MSIFAFDTTRRTNAQAIVDAASLGFLDGEVLDLTIGPEGGFWKRYQPTSFVTNDIDLGVEADLHLDATSSGIPDDWCDVVVWDPPYGYKGATNESNVDRHLRYGLTEYRSTKEIDALLFNGTVEACRIARSGALVKCQDSCVSRSFQHQTGIVARAATAAGFVVAGQLHVYGARGQPTGRRQVNVWANYSTLMLLAPLKRRWRKR